MNPKKLLALAAVAAAVSVPAVSALATNGHEEAPTLIQTVRDATRQFRDVNNATEYTSLGACVSGPQEGAMGIHYAKPSLIGDGQLDPTQPELLIYEQRGGRLRLVGVEFLVDAAQWDASHDPGVTPVLQGQLLNYVGAPNRFGLAAFYELHVWAWRDNPNGSFADFNPAVSCDEYAGEGMTGMNHGG
jgi:hypothetical protein